MFRKDLSDQICPFDQANAFSINIILISDLFHLFYISDPVDIKMIEGQTPFLIYLHDRKCGAADRLFDTKARRQSLGKYCLSYP